ncbi:MAG: glycosyltransferase family 2 protein [Deltaproteobacteria bacterium]|nr:glycosyltransferase family 2 protein [Deltaproteobacteria bacterium]
MPAPNASKHLPLVSIIVRTVDRPYYLRECLTSLLVQDYPNIEIIIVNDGGESVSALVEELGLPFRHQLIELKENRGRSECGNIGLDHASGKYIGFIDDDDIFYSFHISTLVYKLINSNYKVVYSDGLQARQIKCPFNDKMYSTVELTLVLSEEFDFQDLLTRNYIPILCALFDRCCIEEGIRFDTSMDVLEDWDFWIRIARHYDFAHLKQITCEYRYRSDGSNTVGQLDHVWEWCRNHIKHKYSILRKGRVNMELAS